MSDWRSDSSIETYGYNTNRTYTDGFFYHYDPRRMSAIAALAGQPSPDPTVPFTYADFGSGFGMTALLLARALPHGQFFAIDFIKDHITVGRQAAKAMGVKNITYIQAGFDDIVSDVLPPLDYATAHGVLSWVSSEVRGQLRACIKHFLKPNGLFMSSFNHVSGWGDTIAARELLKDGYDLGLEEAAIRDLTLSVINAGVESKERDYPRMLKSIQKENLDYIQHELLNNHWTCFTNRQMASEMAEIDMCFIGPWRSPMQKREVQERPLEITDRVFWEDAFFLRKGASFQRALFAKAPLAEPVLSRCLPLFEGHFTLAPGEDLPTTGGLATTSLRSHAPYASITLKELEELFKGQDGALEMMSAILSPRMIFTSQPVVPVENLRAFDIAAPVKKQFETQQSLNLKVTTIALVDMQATIDVPNDILLILKTCARTAPNDFAPRLASAGWLNEPSPAQEETVESWRREWGPWLAGLGAIEPIDL
jgi:SAM-dependent methyltransferase